MWKEVVNRGDETITINKQKPLPKLCKADRRKEMYFMAERMQELEELVRRGKNAEKSLKELEEEWLKLCEMEIEEARNGRY